MLRLDLDAIHPVSWYPGHMLKAQKELRAKLSLLDVAIVMVDARTPDSSLNPELLARLESKPKLLVLNKEDLADPRVTREWAARWRAGGAAVMTMQANRPVHRGQVLKQLQRVVDAGRRARGARHPLLRAMRAAVIGVPNVGKSSFINGLIRKKRAGVGARPGVTRHQQWVTVSEDCELLDTPGIMVPRVRDAADGLRLGLVACIRDDVVGIETLAGYLIHWLAEHRELARLDVYALPEIPDTIDAVFDALARRWALLLPAGEPDIRAAAARLVQDFRRGKLGRISLEHPEPAPMAERGTEPNRPLQPGDSAGRPRKARF